MPNITIKGVPDPVYRELKAAAARQGRSLNGHVIHLLMESAEDSARRRRMRESWKEYLKFRETLPPTSDSTALIREDRDSR